MLSNTEVKLEVTSLKKIFDRKIIFKDVDFTLNTLDSLAITGKNGSGKSTLIKILANVFTQTTGQVSLSINGKKIEKQYFYKYIGFVSPYLNLYDEFSGYENLKIIAGIRGLPDNNIEPVLKRIGLWERRNDMLKIYSSGMKQRLKIAFSIIHEPQILLFDEPTSNLDAEGVQLVDSIAEEYKNRCILIIATNDEHERSLCAKEINLNNYKKDGTK
ncbi:MAG: ABC transporter ATP-binding protein [Ignavibacteriae bacterium]|nr:MAG: ABC transporter ATP-binding protein [Ignavibacteriota bacterium]